MKDAVKGLERRGDAIMADNNVPEGARTAWGLVKTGIRSFYEVSDLGKFLSPGVANGAARKTQ